MKNKEAVIVGGGFAGLAAGVELVMRGHSVTLFEQRGHLGGRAYSFRDPATGSVLDNGQHIFMGCYQATRTFLKKIGSESRLKLQRNLSVQLTGPGATPCRFRAWPLPSPWHLFGAVASFPGFRWKDRWNFRRIWKSLREDGVDWDKISVTDWLSRSGQSQAAQERFWNPVAFGVLNDRPDLCSAASFRPVLAEAFFQGRAGSRIGLSATGLSDLYVTPAAEQIEKHGGRIFLKTAVQKVHFSGGEFREIELAGGRRISPEVLILAVPFSSLKKILPDAMVYQDPFFHSIHRLKSSPIVAVNLWFDRDFVTSDFVGFWGTRIHWLFNKGRILGKAGGPAYYSLVVSGARDEMQMPGPQLVELARRELAALFPEAAGAKLLHSHVMKEPEATLSPVVGSNGWRLPQKTPYQNLYLAGDWTATGLPATIEGAVRSANRVVELIESDSN